MPDDFTSKSGGAAAAAVVLSKDTSHPMKALDTTSSKGNSVGGWVGGSY